MTSRIANPINQIKRGMDLIINKLKGSHRAIHMRQDQNVFDRVSIPLFFDVFDLGILKDSRPPLKGKMVLQKHALVSNRGI